VKKEIKKHKGLKGPLIKKEAPQKHKGLKRPLMKKETSKKRKGLKRPLMKKSHPPKCKELKKPLIRKEPPLKKYKQKVPPMKSLSETFVAFVLNENEKWLQSKCDFRKKNSSPQTQGVPICFDIHH
jgi:hypothetical protein